MKVNEPQNDQLKKIVPNPMEITSTSTNVTLKIIVKA